MSDVETMYDGAETPEAKTKRIADAVTKLAREMGAENVIVMVSISKAVYEEGLVDDHFHVSWSGAALGCRGLVETGIEKVRTLFARHR